MCTSRFTFALLTFGLEIVTGAQIPLSQVRNDAVDNLLGALSIAGNYIIPGNVCPRDISEPLPNSNIIRMLLVFQSRPPSWKQSIQDFLS